MTIENNNENTAPDVTPTDQPAAEPVASEAAAPGEPAAPEPPPARPDPDAEAMAAFDKGVALAKAEEAPAAAAAPAPASAPVEPPKPAEPAAAAPAVPAPAPDAETDTAVAELGLKGKAESRFREMAGTIKSQAQELEPLRTEAARAREWEDVVMSSTATPEQFSEAMNAIRALNSGDPQAMSAAFDSMLGAVQALGQKLGREVPGLVDPLAGHADLQQAVNEGAVDRRYALELAQQRAHAARLQERGDRIGQQQAEQQATAQAMQGVNALNDRLKAEDPDFARKLPYLQPALDAIRASVPPQHWPQAIETAYRRLPALPPMVAAPPAAPAVSHISPRHPGNVAMQRAPKTDMEAFEMGVRSVSS